MKNANKKEEKKISRVDKVIDSLALFASIIFILLLVVVLVGFLSYWSQIFSQINEGNTSLILFMLGVLIAVVSVIAEWIEGRMKAIIDLVPKIKRKKEVYNDVSQKTSR